MKIKNARVNAIIDCEKFTNEDKARHTLLLTIESNEEINPNDFAILHGKMDIEIHASKDFNCAWQEDGMCTKSYYQGEPARLWWSKRPCFGNPCP